MAKDIVKLAAVAAGASHGDKVPLTSLPPPPTNQPLSGGRPGAPIGSLVASRRTISAIQKFGSAQFRLPQANGTGSKPYIDAYIQTGGNQPTSNSGSTATKEVTDKVKEKLREKIDQMEAAEKQKIIDQLNKEIKPSPNLKASDSTEAIMKKIGAGIGSGEAIAACSAVGAEAATPLCAMAGAFLGEKVSELYYAIGSNVEDAANYVEGKIEEGIDYIGGLF